MCAGLTVVLSRGEEAARAALPNADIHLTPEVFKQVMCSGSEAGSYLRLIDLCITQL